MMEPASEGAPTPTTALPSTFERARAALPSRKRLVRLSHYFDLLGITASMAIMETNEKAMFAGATVSFAMVVCMNCYVRRLWYLIVVFLLAMAFVAWRLRASVLAIEEMEEHGKKFAEVDKEVIGKRTGDALGPQSFMPHEEIRQNPSLFDTPVKPRNFKHP